MHDAGTCERLSSRLGCVTGDFDTSSLLHGRSTQSMCCPEWYRVLLTVALRIFAQQEPSNTHMNKIVLRNGDNSYETN